MLHHFGQFGSVIRHAGWGRGSDFRNTS